RPTPVLGVYPQGPKDVYRVTAQDGASTLASGDHLWFVTTRGGGSVLTTLEISADLGSQRFELPLVQPVEFEPRQVPIDPYVFGLRFGGTDRSGVGNPELLRQSHWKAGARVEVAERE